MHNALYKYKYKGNIYMIYFLGGALVESLHPIPAPNQLSGFSAVGAP